MANVSISKAWDETRAVFARDGKLLVAVAAALVVLPQVIAGVVAPPIEGHQTASQILGIIAGLIGIAAQLSLIRLATGSNVSVGEAIAHGFKRLPMLLAATILLGILLFVMLIPVALVAAVSGMGIPTPGEAPSAGSSGLVLLVLIILIGLSARFIMMAPVASAEEVGPIRIIRRSWELTKGNYWRFLGLVLLLLLLAALLLGTAGLMGGILGRLVDDGIAPFSPSAFVVSLFAGAAQAVFTTVAAVLLARLYVQLSGAGEAEVSVPATRD